ncbi:hypothetical protein CDEF62S_00949 [Castellaniella defragrans]
MDTCNQQPFAAPLRPPGMPRRPDAGMLTRQLAQMLGLRLAVLAEMGSAITAQRKELRRLDLKTLTCIAQLEPLSTGRLVHILGMSPGGVSTVLNRLEDQGLIRRDRSLQDRRQVSLYLADEHVLDWVFPDYAAKALWPVLRDKNPEEVDHLLALLTECMEALTLQTGSEAHATPPCSPRQVDESAYSFTEAL